MDAEGQDLGPHKPVSDALILAAIERAICHGTEQAWIAVVGEHLGFQWSAHKATGKATIKGTSPQRNVRAEEGDAGDRQARDPQPVPPGELLEAGEQATHRRLRASGISSPAADQDLGLEQRAAAL